MNAFVSNLRRNRASIEYGLMLVLIGLAGAASFKNMSLQEVTASPLRFLAFVVLLAALSAAYITISQPQAAAAQPGEAPVRGRSTKAAITELLLTLLLAASFIALGKALYAAGLSRVDAFFALLYSGAAIIVAGKLARRSLPVPQNEGPASAMPPEPQPLAGPIFVEAEDHYVKLVFADRVEHRRARFGEVVASLGDSGLQVHKSFWVRSDSVKGTRRQGRRLILILCDGTEIPVGRSNERKVLELFG